jgi:hypothetical protein
MVLASKFGIHKRYEEKYYSVTSRSSVGVGDRPRIQLYLRRVGRCQVGDVEQGSETFELG